jgi:hypothetical protein
MEGWNSFLTNATMPNAANKISVSTSSSKKVLARFDMRQILSDFGLNCHPMFLFFID